MVYYGNDIYASSLYHHGIKGQKWGVRRFQNEDGSYTQLGKARYASSKESSRAARGYLKEDRRNYKAGKISKQDYETDKVIAKQIFKNTREDRKDIRYAKAADAGRAAYAKSMAKTNDPEKANKKAEKAYYNSIARKWLGGGLLDSGPMLSDYKKAKNKMTEYDFSLSAKQISERQRANGQQIVFKILTDDKKKKR